MQVSKAHNISNIRLIKWVGNKSSINRYQLRLQSRLQEAALQTHYFWLKNNTLYLSELSKWEDSVVQKTGAHFTDYSQFYSHFSKITAKSHDSFNRAWWIENTRLLIPGFKADIASIYHHFESSFLNASRYMFRSWGWRCGFTNASRAVGISVR